MSENLSRYYTHYFHQGHVEGGFRIRNPNLRVKKSDVVVKDGQPSLQLHLEYRPKTHVKFFVCSLVVWVM